MGDGTAIAAEATSISWGRFLYRWGLVITILSIVIGSLVVGCQWRRFMWDYSQPARIRPDIIRDYMSGREAMAKGYLNVYENQVAVPPDEAHKVDCPPLQLATFAAWAYFNQWRYSADRSWNHLQASTRTSTAPATGPQARANVEKWHEEHEFSAFVMYFNTFLEFMAATAALLLVRHWVWRTGPPESRLLVPGHTWLDRQLAMGWRPIAAFCLLWLNPAMVLGAHGWPSWDVWVVPFYLWTILLCCWKYWFIAGIVMGLGIMFKGQQFAVVWIFLLWPLFAGQPGRMLRFAAGFIGTFGLVVIGWMLTYRPVILPGEPARVFDWPAFAWVGSCMAAVVLANGWRLFTGWFRGPCWTPIMALVAYLILRPALGQWGVSAWPLVMLAVMVVAFAWAGRLRTQGIVLFGTMGVALLLCMVYYHGGSQWWELGFRYSTERHVELVIGPGNNLCALLERRFGWSNPMEAVFSIPAKAIFGWPAEAREVVLRELLLCIYLILTLVSTIAIAIHWRRNDRRFLVAVIVPWLLFYAIPAQIHERYLIFASTAAAIVIGCSVGLSMLNLALVALTFLQTGNAMMLANPTLLAQYQHRLLNPDFAQFCDSLRPDISWGVLTATMVFFVAAFMKTRWRRPIGKLALKPAA